MQKEREDLHPFVSVIMPIYNVCTTNPHYLREALAIVRRQTHKNFGLLIVNDGSSDGSEKICQDFILENPELRGRYSYKENGGQSRARHFGVKLTNDQYLKGNGIEIGTLNMLLKVPECAKVRYIDRKPVRELKTDH